MAYTILNKTIKDSQITLQSAGYLGETRSA